MKNDLLRRLETKAELKYAALYQAKMRMTLQIAQDAAMIAANEVLQMGPGRAKEFAMAFTEAVNDIGTMMFEDQQDDSMSDEIPPDNERVLVYRPCMVDSDTGPYSVQWGWAAKRDGSHWARLPDRRPPEGEEDK